MFLPSGFLSACLRLFRQGRSLKLTLIHLFSAIVALRTRCNRFRCLRARPPTRGRARCASIASSAETSTNGEGCWFLRLEECTARESRPQHREHREPWQWHSIVSRNAWRDAATLAREKTATLLEQSWGGLGSAPRLGKPHARRNASPVLRTRQRAARFPSRFGRVG